MRITILEGADGSGKTTTAEQIADKWEAMVLHQGPFAASPILETMVAIDTAVTMAEQFGTKHLVLDRCHIGELIYGPLFRGHSKIDLETAILLSAWIKAKHDTRIILCAPPFKVVKHNWQTNGKVQMYDADSAEVVYLAYKALAEVAPLMFDVTFDYTKQDWDEVV